MVTESPVTDQGLLLAAEIYAATFSGRLDAYSFWNGDHWQTAKNPDQTLRPLTPQVVLNAFETRIPISGYVLSPEATTHVACLDIDRENGLELGNQFGRYLQHLNAVGYVERSSRGCHLWMVLSEPRPAVVIRSALKAMIKEAGLPPCPGGGQRYVQSKEGKPICAGCGRNPEPRGQNKAPMHPDPKIELRPAQDRLNNAESLGTCIRLPTMPHHRTGKRYGLVSTDGEPVPAKLKELVGSIDFIDAKVFDEASQRAPLPPLRGSPLDLRYPHGDPPVSGSACTILMQLWGVVECSPGRAIICPAHDDRRPSLSIAKDDQRVWCKTGGCILSNDGRGRGTWELTQLAPKGPGLP